MTEKNFWSVAVRMHSVMMPMVRKGYLLQWWSSQFLSVFTERAMAMLFGRELHTWEGLAQSMLVWSFVQLQSMSSGGLACTYSVLDLNSMSITLYLVQSIEVHNNNTQFLYSAFLG